MSDAPHGTRPSMSGTSKHFSCMEGEHHDWIDTQKARDSTWTRLCSHLMLALPRDTYLLNPVIAPCKMRKKRGGEGS